MTLSRTLPPVLLILLALSAPAQEPQAHTLTNELVIKLLRGGLDSSNLVLMIQSSPTDFDTSPEALLALQEAGASAEVLAAVLKSQVAQEGADGESEGQQVPRLNRSGAVLVSAEGGEELRPAQQAGFKTGFNPYSSKIKTQISGERARLRTTEPRPEFVVTLLARSYPEDSVILVKVESKKGVRLIVTGKRGVIAGHRMQIPEEERIALSFGEPKEAGSSYFQSVRATPVSALEKGEYLLVIESRFYDFGVD